MGKAKLGVLMGTEAQEEKPGDTSGAVTMLQTSSMSSGMESSDLSSPIDMAKDDEKTLHAAGGSEEQKNDFEDQMKQQSDILPPIVIKKQCRFTLDEDETAGSQEFASLLEESSPDTAGASNCDRRISANDGRKCLEENTLLGIGEEAEIRSRKAGIFPGWLVLACSCAQVMCTLGIIPSYSVMYREPLMLFGTDATLKSWIYNLAKSLLFASGCLAGPLGAVYGNRILIFGVISGSLGLIGSSLARSPYVFFFTHSVLVSMGFGFSHFLSYINLQKTFSKRRGFANGIYMGSSAFGKIVTPQLIQWLTNEYGYRWMMRIMAAISLHGIAFGLIISSEDTQKRRKQKIMTRSTSFSTTNQNVAKSLMTSPASSADVENLASSGSTARFYGCCCCGEKTRQKFRGSMDFTVFKEPIFLFLTTIDCLLSMTIGSMAWALPFYAHERGMSPEFGASLLSTAAACELVGRFILPPLFDVKWLNYQYVFTVLLLIAAGSSTGIGLKPSVELTLVLCGIFGLAHSGTMGMPNILLIKHLSIDRFASTMSAKTVFKFLFFCLGPILGVLVDVTGSYSTCLYVFAGLLVLTAGLSAMFPLLVSRTQKATTGACDPP